MQALSKHWPRIVATLLPLVFAVLHALGLVNLQVLNRLDASIYDARLRATAPQTLDPRIVIVDIDEKSLAELGRWPWSRNTMATLVDALFVQQKIEILGFDIVFAEVDTSSGLAQLQALANNAFKDQAGFAQRVEQLKPTLDYDGLFARSLQQRPVVMGYYFSEEAARTSGVLPQPVIAAQALQGRSIHSTSWNGFGSNIAPLAHAAPLAGFFNSITDGDGVVRALPLLAEYRGDYYESLALGMFRALAGAPAVQPGYTPHAGEFPQEQALDRLLLDRQGQSLAIAVNEKVSMLVPYRGRGGVHGGSFQYVSAADVLNGRLAPLALKDKIVLLGTTAPGLLDLRVTPMGETYPGVETHANAISGLLDGRILYKPDYAAGYDLLLLTTVGLTLAFGLPLLSAVRAIGLALGAVGILLGLNLWLYLSMGLVLPLAAALVMVSAMFALHLGLGYFVENRTKRELASLFGTYVPPELVDEMLKDPDAYSMQASNQELTVMFCDMRGFTDMSENMEPTQLQALLNGVFSRLTSIIRTNRGTIDKYMGDCVMAFWGAPVHTPDHAHLAVLSALEMVRAVEAINADHRARGLPQIGIGIGLNTGTMCVGDMGSDIRRSYTVIGDAVNLGARLEGLSKVYGVGIVASESTRNAAPDFVWQALDRVRVKGKAQAVAIFLPSPHAATLTDTRAQELALWTQFREAYTQQQWDQAQELLTRLRHLAPEQMLYHLAATRVTSMRARPIDPLWDGVTSFDSK